MHDTRVSRVDEVIHNAKLIVGCKANTDGAVSRIGNVLVPLRPQLGFGKPCRPFRKEFRVPDPLVERLPLMPDRDAESPGG